MVIEKKYYDIAQRELEEMQREINAEKAQMSEEEILEDKKWHDEQLETIIKKAEAHIIKVFLYLILAVMTLIHWLLKIPMILGNILLYFLSIIFILTGVLSYGFALESARECGRMIIIGMAFGAIPDFVPFLGKSLETLVAKLLSMTNE